MARLEPVSRFRAEDSQQHVRGTNLKNFKRLSVAVCLVYSLCVSVVAQTRITPEAPVGKGTVVLKAARLIDGTGAVPINNAVVVITDNKISAAGAAGSVRVP